MPPHNVRCAHGRSTVWLVTALLALILGACRGPLLDLHAEAPARVWAAAPVCAEVAVKAAAAGHSAAWLARLAFRESRLRRDVCSAAGACGPLQAVPGYWCEGGALGLQTRQGRPLKAATGRIRRGVSPERPQTISAAGGRFNAEPCDLVEAGVRAWGHYERKAGGDRERALCWYTGRRGCV